MPEDKFAAFITSTRNLVIMAAAALLLYALYAVYGDINLMNTYRALFSLLPIPAVAFLGWWAFQFWVHYIQQDFISGIEWVMLEIVPPRDVLRSPMAMELFITNALYHFSSKGGREEFWQGAVWFWFSLEIVSIDGQVHFYIRTPSRLKGLIETQMYAQYPQAQVKVVEDYTLAVPEIVEGGEWKGWGCEFMTNKSVMYPIKTYVDYGLDKDPDEEQKIDPISPVIELFGSLKKGEQMWLQIVITPKVKIKYKVPGKFFEKEDWQNRVERELIQMLEPYTSARKRDDVPGTFGKEIRAPKYMEDIVDGASRKMQKLGFETGIRAMYIAKKEAFDMSSRRNLRLIFRQYESPFLNGFLRVNSTQADVYGAGGFFSLGSDVITKVTDRLLTEYRERSFFHNAMRHNLLAEGFPLFWPISPFFYPGYKHQHTFVLNTEELATLWHFPGQILKVPTLERIESKEASPPPNLPT